MNKEIKNFLKSIRENNIEEVKSYLNKDDFNPAFLEQAALEEVCINNQKEIILLFHKSGKFNFGFQTELMSPFLSALSNCDMEIINLFLKEKELNILNNIEYSLIAALNNESHLPFKTILEIAETNNIKFDYEKILNEFIYIPTPEVLKIIIDNKNFDITFSDYLLFFDLLFFVEYHKGYKTKKEVLSILLSDDRYEFIDFKEIEKRINNRIELLKYIYSIKKLKIPLMNYLNLWKKENKKDIEVLKKIDKLKEF